MIKGVEVFMMPGNSCFCMSMGEWVMRGQRPFVWIPGEKPFLVTKAEALRIICPIRYRHYADQVQAMCPVFRMMGKATKSKVYMSNYNAFGTPGISSGEAQDGDDISDVVQGPDENIDIPMSVPSDSLSEEVVDDVPSDPYLFVRTKSKRALIKEASSLRHLMSHYPFNPYCEICVTANMKQKRYHRRTEREDDGLPAASAPKQQCSTDIIIISKSSSDAKRVSSDNEFAAHTIRDTYSGVAYAVAMTART